jgi:hypothetical protein
MSRVIQTAAILLLAGSALVQGAPCNTTITACGQLAAQFPEQLFYSDVDEFGLRTHENIWAMQCYMEPRCVFMPTSAEHVSEAVKIVQARNTTFSVVSGGHMPVRGAQSNDDGVLIAMANMNAMDLNEDSSIASIGPGNRWIQVYDWLSEHDVAVAGGRYSPVGVGGLLLNGGVSFFGNRHGWGVNTLEGLEVVLGNGTIIEVNREAHSDLFWAMKGGSNNFGIVTRYDLRTFPMTAAYGGLIMWQGEEAMSDFVDAFESFLFSPEGIDDLDTHVNPSFTLSRLPDGSWWWRSVLVSLVAGDYEGTPASMTNFTAIDSESIIVSTTEQESNWVQIPHRVHELNEIDVNGQGQLFGTITSTIAPGVIQLMIDTVLQAALTELADIPGVFTAVSQQPMPTSWLQAAHDDGEYAIGLDPNEGLLVLLVTVTWQDPAHDTIANEFLHRSLERLRVALVELELYRPFLYLGDAAAGQYPYAGYGAGDGAVVERMRSVQTSYDPLGVFRNLITSGFRL